MIDHSTREGEIISTEDAQDRGKTKPEVWLLQIDAQRRLEQDWRNAAMKAEKIYEAHKEQVSQFNIYHANVQTLVPTLFNSTPIPDVRRRWEPEDVDPEEFGVDPNEQPPQQPDEQMAQDPQAMEQHQQAVQAFQQKLMPYQQAVEKSRKEARLFKQVADIQERAIVYVLDMHPFAKEMKSVVRHGGVVGRGVPRIMYEPEIDKRGMPGRQTVKLQVVPWNKFIPGPGLHWDDAPWHCFEHDLTKAEVEKLLKMADMPESKRAQKLTKYGFDAVGNNTDDGTDQDRNVEAERTFKGSLKTIRVYEVWDRDTKAVLFVTPADRFECIAELDDPLKLESFFPIPRPFYLIERLASLTPICPYDVYEQLIKELEAISKRIQKIIEAVKAKGLYDPKMAPDFERLKDCKDGEYIPASAKKDFEKGGGGALDDAVMHWPVEQYAKVLQILYAEREQVKTVIFEVTGLMDIMRGAVNPREKLGQSQMKNQWTSIRVQDNQDEAARVARDSLRIIAEVIAKHFTEQNLHMMTGLRISQEAIQVLRSDQRMFVIDIETDSTIQATADRDREQVNMFLQGSAQFGQTMANLAPILPATIEPMAKVYTSFARKFKLGKSGEDALDELMEAAKQPPVQEQQEQQPDPAEMARAQSEAEMQAEGLRHKNAIEIKQMEQQHQLQLEQMKMEGQQQAEASRIAADAEKARSGDETKKAIADLAAIIKQYEADRKSEQAALDREARAAEQEAELSVRSQENENARYEADRKIEHDSQERAEDRGIKREEVAAKSRAEKVKERA